MTHLLKDLIALTRALGEPARDYVIIGEGNTSVRLDAESFAVKASGQQMRDIAADGFVSLRLAPLLAMLDDPPSTLSEQKRITASAILPANSPAGTEGSFAVSPSIEASFHAMLLHECGVRYIGHTHPPPSIGSCAANTPPISLPSGVSLMKSSSAARSR